MIKREASGRFAGIYALPSLHSVWDWHGVISVRAGLYQHGVFKFSVKLPVKYPLEAPKVRKQRKPGEPDPCQSPP